MTLTADLGTSTSSRSRPGRGSVVPRVRPRGRRWPRSSPVPSASARSRSPTTSATSRASSIEARPEVDLALPATCCRCRPRSPTHPNTEPGLTRLIRADRLGAALGIRNLWVKDDTGNPTHSFKDRVVAVALAAARELGFTGAVPARPPATWPTPSPPRPRAPGWDSVVLIPSSLEQAKVLTTAVYGGTLLAVDGNYDDVNRLATELAAEHEDWAFVNVNVRPYYAEGSKTLGYEVAEQLGWRLPEQIVVPVASGSQLTKVDKGFTELGKLGLVEATPYRVFGAQATGCSPVAHGVRGGPRRDPPRAAGHHRPLARDRQPGRRPVRPRHGAAHRRRGGARDRRPRSCEGIRLLARTEGVFAETAGGVTVATTRKLVESGQLDPDAETVLLITGDGLKTLDAVSDQVGPTATVPSTTKAVREALRAAGR